MNPADQKALARAIGLGLAPKVKAALAKKPDVNGVLKLQYGRKSTLLLEAANRESAEIVGMLLDAGAKVTDRDEYGRSVLQQTRYVEVAKRLLDAGADVAARDLQKRTALHTACEVGDVDVVLLLLERGAEVDARDKEGKTPYVSGDKPAVRALLKKHGAKGLETTDGRALKPKVKAGKISEVDIDGSAIGVDGEGRLWIGGNEGIYRWDGKALTQYVFNESFAVDQIEAGPKGLVYFSTNWGLVTCSGDAWRLYTTSDSELHDAHITSMAVDRLGRAHLMGYGGEEKVDRPISVFDGKGFTVLTAGNGIPKGLETLCLAFDAKNRIVFGTNDGVTFPDGTRWNVPGEGGGLKSVKAITTDGDVVWAGACRGAHRIENGKSTHVRTLYGVKVLLVRNHELFVGMSYGGMLHVPHPLGAEPKLYKDDCGLTEEDVENLALAPDGTVWIAAGNKLFSFADGVIRPFDGKPLAAAPKKDAAKPEAPKKEAPKKEAPKPKKRKLATLPAKALVSPTKVAKHVLDATKKTKIAGLPPEALLKFLRPAIGIEIGKPVKAAVGASKLGGRPDLAGKTTWPTYEDDDDRYLPFLLQVNLADVKAFDIEGLLPKKGLLSFFVDTVPDELENGHVLYADGAKKPTRAEWPEDLVDRKNESDFVAQLPEHALSFYSTWTLPSVEYLSRYAELSADDEDALRELEVAIHAKDPKGSSATRLLGWPDNVQGELFSSDAQIALLQIDASMKAPKKLGEVFGYWGNGLAHVVLSAKDLAAKKLDRASVMLAYT
ncbi:hypothetical protein BH09MYX1_BH09MYX1_24730 [soil metagenome]